MNKRWSLKRCQLYVECRGHQSATNRVLLLLPFLHQVSDLILPDPTYFYWLWLIAEMPSNSLLPTWVLLKQKVIAWKNHLSE